MKKSINAIVTVLAILCIGLGAWLTFASIGWKQLDGIAAILAVGFAANIFLRD